MAKILRRSILALLAIIIVLVLLVEVGGRYMITKSMQDGDSDASISLGSSSLVLAAATNSVKEVSIHSPSTLQITYPNGGDGLPEISGNPATDITLTGYHIYGEKQNTADHMVLTTTLTNDLLLAMIQTGVQQSLDGINGEQEEENSSWTANLSRMATNWVSKLITISGVETNPTDGTVTVNITDGLGKVTLTPTVNNGTLDFGKAELSVFGLGLPDNIEQKITDGLKNATAQLNQQLAFTALTVESNGVRVTMEGDDVDLKDGNALGVDASAVESAAESSTSETTSSSN
ncbi:MAG: hypothetical protein Q3972_07390 [Corynebacterium sp.]|nr:hypothetical protein [Corynebacterium sp.]